MCICKIYFSINLPSLCRYLKRFSPSYSRPGFFSSPTFMFFTCPLIFILSNLLTATTFDGKCMLIKQQRQGLLQYQSACSAGSWSVTCIVSIVPFSCLRRGNSPITSLSPRLLTPILRFLDGSLRLTTQHKNFTPIVYIKMYKQFPAIHPIFLVTFSIFALFLLCPVGGLRTSLHVP